MRSVQKRNKRKKLYFYAPAFLIMVYTGMRLGEMLGLKKSSVDKQKMMLYVEEQCVREYARTEDGKRLGKTNVIRQPKTESSIRSIPITQKVLEWIELLDFRQKFIGIESVFVVTNMSGKHPSRTNIDDMWNRILEDAKVEHVTVHKLRKTFVTNMIKNGVSIPTVSAMAGHKNATTTINDYYKISNNIKMREEMRLAMEGLYKDEKKAEIKSVSKVIPYGNSGNSLYRFGNSFISLFDKDKKRETL